MEANGVGLTPVFGLRYSKFDEEMSDGRIY
jgi:hypothetical protein